MTEDEKVDPAPPESSEGAKEQAEQEIQENDDEQPRWEQIALDPLDKEFLQPAQEEIRTLSRTLEDLNNQITTLTSRRDQTLGYLDSQKGVVTRYLSVLEKRYGIPKDVKFVLDLDRFRLVRNDIFEKEQKATLRETRRQIRQNQE